MIRIQFKNSRAGRRHPAGRTAQHSKRLRNCKNYKKGPTAVADDRRSICNRPRSSDNLSTVATDDYRLTMAPPSSTLLDKYRSREDLVGLEVAKAFIVRPEDYGDDDGVFYDPESGEHQRIFVGEVTETGVETGSLMTIYHVVYEDGDEEDLYYSELEEAAELFHRCHFIQEVAAKMTRATHK